MVGGGRILETSAHFSNKSTLEVKYSAPFTPQQTPSLSHFCFASSGLHMEALEEEERQEPVKPLVPEYGAVLDLLKNLPDAVPVSAQVSTSTRHKEQKSVTQEKSPRPAHSVSRKSSTTSLGREVEEDIFEEDQRFSTRSRGRKNSLEYSTVC